MATPKTVPSSGLAASLGGLVKQKVDPIKLAAEVKLALGISLMATAPTDVVHGHASTISKQAGMPFGYASDGSTIDVCPMCDTTVPTTTAHDCCEVVLYEAAESPNTDHKSSLAKHGLTVAKKAQLLALMRAHLP